MRLEWRDMKTSESIKELQEALAKAQGEMKGAKKESTNDFFKDQRDPKKGKYADSDSVREAYIVSFAKHGLCYTQNVFTENGIEYVESRIGFGSQWIEYGPLRVPMKDKDNAHQLKSGSTYCKRIQTLGATGLSEADDDGNAAVGKGETIQKAEQANPQIQKTGSSSVKEALDKAQAVANAQKKPIPNMAPKGRFQDEPPF